jgi:predicted ATPase with chaperone activity
MFYAGGDTVLCMTQLNLSARAYHRILKLARTIVVWREVMKSSHHIWRRHCSTGRSYT